MRCILILIAILIIATSLFSQYYEPQNPLAFDKTAIEKSAISRKIAATRTLFTTIDIDELKIQIKKNNNAVDNQIALIKNQMTGMFMDKQELLKLVDIKKMEEQIALKEKSRNDIKGQIQQDLANIVYYGLYGVVLNDIDPFASKEQLAEQAEKLLAPIAIEDLNGVFVSSLTVVQDNKLLLDQIKATISGQMGIEKQYLSRTIANRTKFLCLVKVNVAPLKKALAATTPYTISATRHLTLNFLSDYDYQTRLKQAGIPDAEIKEIESEVSAAREVINSSNAMSTRRQQQIMGQGNANLNKVDEEIAELKNSLANRSRLLKQTIEGKTNVIYNAQDITGCINKALSYFDRKIKELQDQMIAVKEKELIIKDMVNVTAEGKPEEDIAKTAVDVSGQIRQSYSKVEQFIHETEVANFMLTSDKTASAKDIFREVDKIWLYPVAGERDNFLLTVVARFKISGVKEHSPAPVADRRIDETTPKYADMVFVQGGTFMMGSNDGAGDEKPIHKVYVSDFYMDKYEVTNAQFCQFLNEKGNQTEGGAEWQDIGDEDCKIMKQGTRYVPVSGYDNHPVIEVSWYGANAYAQCAGKRLPTEAEWEYAARGANISRGYKYSGSNNADAVAWWHKNSGGQTHPVGTKQPNELGLYDMSGNVWEWCADWYDSGYYSKSPYENPTGPASGQVRVMRGGSWSIDEKYLRCSYRNYDYPHPRYDFIGFRLVR